MESSTDTISKPQDKKTPIQPNSNQSSTGPIDRGDKIAREIAEKDVQDWLDFKKVSESRREEKQDAIDTLVGAICEGVLVLRDGFKWEQTLKFPLENEITTRVLTYPPQLCPQLTT